MVSGANRGVTVNDSMDDVFVFDCHHTGVGRRVFADQNQMLFYIGDHELTLGKNFHLRRRRATPRLLELAAEEL